MSNHSVRCRCCDVPTSPTQIFVPFASTVCSRRVRFTARFRAKELFVAEDGPQPSCFHATVAANERFPGIPGMECRPLGETNSVTDGVPDADCGVNLNCSNFVSP